MAVQSLGSSSGSNNKAWFRSYADEAHKIKKKLNALSSGKESDDDEDEKSAKKQKKSKSKKDEKDEESDEDSNCRM